jgi:hypothetical protein
VSTAQRRQVETPTGRLELSFTIDFIMPRRARHLLEREATIFTPALKTCRSQLSQASSPAMAENARIFPWGPLGSFATLVAL